MTETTQQETFTRRNRGKIAGIGGSMLLVAGIAFAASIVVTQGQSGGGEAVVATCDSAVTSTFGTPTYDATEGGYVISDVDVTNIDAGCAGETLYLTVANGSGVSQASGSVVIAGTSENVTLSGDVLISNAENTAIAIQPA